MTETLTGLTLARLAPWLTPVSDPAGDHATYLSALASMGEQLFGLVWDQGDPDDPDYQSGWSALFDVDTCPYQFLPFLAQLVGVSLPSGLSDADARSIIRLEQGMSRGTPAAIIAAAQRFLSATKSAVIVERNPDPYSFVLIVRPEEITDLAGLLAAVEAVKPAGLLWVLVQSDAPLLSQYTRLFSAITATLAAATLADVT